MSMWRMVRPYCVLVALLVGAAFAGRACTRAAEARGFAKAEAAADLRVAQADSLRWAALQAMGQAERRTDSVLTAATQKAQTVRTVTQRVPQVVRDSYPVVDTLIVESLALAAALDSVMAVVQTERVAAANVRAVDAATIKAQAVVITTLERRITQLQKRPTRTRALLYTAAALGVGFLIGDR